ncbi:hypothetical protein [Algoriphagus jejuensis]
MKNPQKRFPFVYRSFLNFWLVLILPSSVLATIITQLYYDGSIHFELLKEFSPWLNCGIFQVFFGFFAYIWLYLPAVKKFKKDADSASPPR